MVKKIVLNNDSIVSENPQRFVESFKFFSNVLNENFFEIYHSRKIIQFSNLEFAEMNLTSDGKTLYDFYQFIENPHDWITLISIFMDSNFIVNKNIDERNQLISSNSLILSSFAHNSIYCTDCYEVELDSIKYPIRNIFNCETLESNLSEIIISDFTERILEDDLIIINKCGKNRIGISKILFHDQFVDEYRAMQKKYQDKFLKIYSAILRGEKVLRDYDYHGESETVRNGDKYKAERKVKFQKVERIIYYHLKLDKDVSVYMEIENEILYVGKFTHHLSTKKN